jgi:hypothetical protein
MVRRCGQFEAFELRPDERICRRAAYARNFLPRSVTSRPLKGNTPTIDLVLGYKKSNQSAILKLLLSRLDELVARASNKTP